MRKTSLSFASIDTMTRHKSTRLLHAGRAAGEGPLPVNPPVVRTSTVLFSDMAALRDAKGRRDTGERLMSYGRRGTSSAFALEDALCELEGGARARLVPSGLCAVTIAFIAFLRPGDHVLIADCVYEPVRRVCRDFLTPFGIDFTFFPAGEVPSDSLLRSNTRMIYTECPGSLTYELSDLRALAAVARRYGARLVVDNTWGSGYLYNPLALGADVSVLAATKYIVGHSDVMMGALVATQDAWRPIATAADTLGVTCSPDDCYLALRGLRTMRCGWRNTSATHWRWRSGCANSPACGRCFIRHCRRILAMHCGSATSRAPTAWCRSS